MSKQTMEYFFLKRLESFIVSKYKYNFLGPIVGLKMTSCSSMHACMLSRFSCVQLCVTLQNAARQAPLSMGFSR